MSGGDFIKNIKRYCLLISDENLSRAKKIKEIDQRLREVKKFRKSCKSLKTKNLAKSPHRFIKLIYKNNPSLVIPLVSSSKRDYIPVGFMKRGIVFSDKVYIAYNPPQYLLSILSSRMHMAWVKTHCGKARHKL